MDHTVRMRGNLALILVTDKGMGLTNFVHVSEPCSLDILI